MRNALLAAVFVALASLPGLAFGQQATQAQVVAACGTPNSTYSAGTTKPLTQDTTGKNCVAATVSATATTTATASATPTAVSAGTGKPLNIDLFSELFVQPAFAGTPVDGTHGLPVNCIVGCAGGTSNNNADTVATSATNGQTLAWLYAFNGSTWDRLQDDASKNLKVNLQTVPSGAYAAGSLAAGAGVDGWDLTQGSKADAAYAGSGNATTISALKGIYGALASPLPAGSNIIGKVGVDQTTPGTTNGTAIVGVNAATALAGNGTTGTGSLRVTIASDNSAVAGVGAAATGGAVPANAVLQGVDAQSAEPAKATTGNLTPMFGDLTGKVVTSPYANRENMVRGSASATGTGATTLIAAGGASVKTYITDVECGRDDAGTTAMYVTLSDAASTVLVLPNSGGGGGNNKTFNTPLVTAANTAFTFTASAGITTIRCSAQGFSGY